MAKSMRNAVREAAKVAKEREELIKIALDNGHTTRSTIVTATGLGKNVVSNMLSENKELRALWILRKRDMVSTALDNIEDIINDSKHKDNGTMSKWVVSNIDSDIGSLLFPHNDIEMTIPGGDNEGASDAVVIKFTSPRKDD
tara:strand:- start:59 stop:484 length:426 start_codon:yes stop_codon:yes gene_type:complete